MIHIVTPSNRHLYSHALDGMYRDRKRVFVDWLKWKVPVVNGIYEIDQFDTDDAIYLIELDPLTRKHLASIRLLPTTKPNLLGEVFPSLCEKTPPPRATDTWELTRFCVTPDVPKADVKRLMNLMWTSVVEFAVANDIAHYTCVTHMALLSVILAAGWDTEPLGLPQTFDGGLIGAVLFHIKNETLGEAHKRFGYTGSVFANQQIEAA
jgi:N-acyl-L-homoserine lactone synthetase